MYYYFAAWRDDGTDQTLHDLLRCQVRERAGRGEDPTAVVLDTQTVHTSVNAPAATTGLDAGKKSRGRKRGLAVDVLGLLIAVVVAAANVHDNAIGIQLVDKVQQHPFSHGFHLDHVPRPPGAGLVGSRRPMRRRGVRSGQSPTKGTTWPYSGRV